MPSSRRISTLILAVTVAVGACDAGPVVTDAPSSGGTTPSPAATPATTEIPFAPAAWPAANACEDPAFEGRLGRIEALDALTVRFTLCTPDGAFRTRLAHPSLAVVDATTIAGLAGDRAGARSIPGSGPYRIESWTDEGVTLGRVTADPPQPLLETLVVGWSASTDARIAALVAASVDGIDAPGLGETEGMATQPELAVLPRRGLGTSYLGFGAGPSFASVRVRRAVSMAIDRDALAASAGPGSVAAISTAPCDVAGGCAGTAWYAFNAPSAIAALAAAKFDLQVVYPLQVPDGPVPGLPDPAAMAEAVRDRLLAGLGLNVRLEVVPTAALAASIADGRVAGLYLWGVTSPLADAAGFLEPLFGRAAGSTAAGRATGVADILDELARTTGIAARAEVIGRANDAVRSTAPIVPLVHPGSVAVLRADVAGATASPLGVDALGAFVPGDRRQLVFVGATEPGSAWCADQASLDAYRLCGLVTEGLYGFEPGVLTIEPRLAVRCTPEAEATAWTCRLRPGATFHDGMRLDAGDVLASFAAQGDAGGALRRAAPEGAFATWDALFGPVPGG